MFDFLEFTLGARSSLAAEDVAGAIGVVSIEVLARAEDQLGMPSDLRAVLRSMMRIWSRQVSASATPDPRRIVTSLAAVCRETGLGKREANERLEALQSFLPLQRDKSGANVSIDLAVLLPVHDPMLTQLVTAEWARRHVEAHRQACQAMLIEIEEAVDRASEGGDLDAFSSDLGRDLAEWQNTHGGFLLDGSSDLSRGLADCFSAYWAMRPLHERALVLTGDGASELDADRFCGQTRPHRLHGLALQALLSESEAREFADMVEARRKSKVH